MRFVRLLTLATFALTRLGAAEHGTLVLHFLQLPVGEETYDFADNVLRANFEYTERGSKVPLTTTLRMQPDLTPLQFEAHGRNYRPFTVDASFTLSTPPPRPFLRLADMLPSRFR